MAIRLEDLPAHVQDAIRRQDAREAAARAPAGKGAPLARAMKRASGLNQTEQAYADHLEHRRRAGEIIDYRAQAMTFRLGPDCRYTPDFLVVEADSTLTLVDVKGGHTWEDSVIKLKTAAQQFPWFAWQMVQRRDSGWHVVRELNRG